MQSILQVWNGGFRIVFLQSSQYNCKPIPAVFPNRRRLIHILEISDRNIADLCGSGLQHALLKRGKKLYWRDAISDDLLEGDCTLVLGAIIGEHFGSAMTRVAQTVDHTHRILALLLEREFHVVEIGVGPLRTMHFVKLILIGRTKEQNAVSIRVGKKRWKRFADYLVHLSSLLLARERRKTALLLSRWVLLHSLQERCD